MDAVVQIIFCNIWILGYRQCTMRFGLVVMQFGHISTINRLIDNPDLNSLAGIWGIQGKANITFKQSIGIEQSWFDRRAI